MSAAVFADDIPHQPAPTPLPAISSTPAPTRDARTVKVTEKTTIVINASLLESTLIVLPEQEKITAVFEGDKENWRYDTTKVSGRYLSVKPTSAGAKTDLHILSDHGNSYSFILQEISGQPGVSADTKVFIEPGDSAMRASLLKLPEFVPAEEAERYKHEAQQAKQSANQVSKNELSTIRTETEMFRATYPSKLRFNYRWNTKAAEKLGVEQIFSDDKFTYLRAHPPETPSLYEVRDNKPSLINFEFRDGLYTVPKLISQGYLAVGKNRMDFWTLPQAAQ